MAVRYPIVLVGTTLQELPEGDSIAGSIVTAGNAEISNNLANGTLGSIPYQTSANNTAFLTIGPNQSLLVSNGSVPQWTNLNSLNVGGSVVTDNISGGFAGSIPYQIDENNTGFLPIGPNNSILISNGLSPQWSSSANISVSSSTNSTNANFLLVGSDYRSASIDTPNIGTPNTIACRDADGNLNATVFQGQSTASQAADLAEKYIPDQHYEVGTVVTIGGDEEITSCNLGDKAIGVVSENPAFMMNSTLKNGIYVALKGRVPVKVIGKIKKGNKLIATNNGIATVTINFNDFNIFAIALTDDNNENVRLIECLIL